MSAEEIAARFGVTASVVRQRLKLGAVSPAPLHLYREFVASLTMDDLLSLLAHCASLSLDAVQRAGLGPRERPRLAMWPPWRRPCRMA